MDGREKGHEKDERDVRGMMLGEERREEARVKGVRGDAEDEGEDGMWTVL